MLKFYDLSRAIDAYLKKEVTLDEFADWFRLAFRVSFPGADQELLDVVLGVSDSLQSLYSQEITEARFREDLALLSGHLANEAAI